MPRKLLSSQSGSGDAVTPMLRQFYDLKEQVGSALLFFRMGDFYELFDDDAVLAAPLLGIVLTTREKGNQTKIPFCGVPYHSYQHYLTKLLRLGYKVAIAEQFADEPTTSNDDGGALRARSKKSSSSGPMVRRVVRIHTPGCTDEIEALCDDRPLYLAAAYECPQTQKWALALCEYSTGELRVGTVNSRSALCEYLSVMAVRELLVRRFQIPQFQDFGLTGFPASSSLVLSELPESALRGGGSQLAESWQQMIQHSDSPPSSLEVQVLAGLEAYFHELQALTHHILTSRTLSEPTAMRLGDVVIRDLEIFRSSAGGGEKGSLWSVICHTQTAMGARALRYRLLHPYCRSGDIQRSHNAIEMLLGQPGPAKGTLLTRWRRELSGMCDLERVSRRCLRGVAFPPSQALGLMESLGKALRMGEYWRVELGAEWLDQGGGGEGAVPLEGDPELKLEATKKPVVEPENTESTDLGVISYFTHLIDQCCGGQDIYEHLIKILDPGAVDLGSGVGVIRRGYSDDYDAALDHHESTQDLLYSYIEELRKTLGIPSLKVREHKTYGFLIEVTKTHASKIGRGFRHKQTMVQAMRYTTDELESLCGDLSQARGQAVELEQQIYHQQIIEYLRDHGELLWQISAALGELDVQCGWAYLAKKNHYTRPVIGAGSRLFLEGSHHPVVATMMPAHKYVKCCINMEDPYKQMLITGPNMGGKSTVMRQVALNALLSQVGSYVPCERAELPLFDAIFTRIGAHDDLAGGRSTFMVEMSEAAQILRRSTKRSLVIFDELGRGTSTRDGVALAYSVLCEYAQQTHSWVMFATHYHELARLSRSLESVRSWQTEAVHRGGKMVFTYRLIEGVCPQSFGLATAQLAGLPQRVLDRAREYISALPAEIPQSSEFNLESLGEGVITGAGTGQGVQGRRDGLQGTREPTGKAGMVAGAASAGESYSKDIAETELTRVVQAIIDQITHLDIAQVSPLKALHLMMQWHENLSPAISSTVPNSCTHHVRSESSPGEAQV